MMARTWTFTHMRCAAFAEDKQGRTLVCSRSIGHKAELCYDSSKQAEFIPDHPRQFTIKGRRRA